MPNTTPRIDALPALPRDHSGPVFAAPWEAQAFALAVQLSAAGFFTWGEWVEAFSQQIHAAQAQGDPDLGETYYQHWLMALERLCTAKGLVDPQDLCKRTEEWRLAYRNTPHGHPVTLSAAFNSGRREV
jgi:nitrile hydratase accessory protein